MKTCSLGHKKHINISYLVHAVNQQLCDSINFYDILRHFNFNFLKISAYE